MCEIGTKFANIQYYNKEMQKGMEDKLFFLDKLPTGKTYTFVDFGCADGAMINALTHILGIKHLYIGYDISDTMINLARTNYNGPVDAEVQFTTNWEDVKEMMKDGNSHRDNTVLILSSVIHEVYSYGTDESIKEFWNNVLNSGFDYVVIRDMCPSADIETLASQKNIDKINYTIGSTKQVIEFCRTWGSLSSQKNLVHFLLKYRWKVNWKREVKENYFPITVEELLHKFLTGKNTFNIDYFERFRVPFLDKCIKEDFDIELEDYTHIKAIFTKKFKNAN